MKKDLKQNLPYHLIRLSTKCNAHCLFCNVPAESVELACDYSVSEIKKQILKLARASQKIKLSFSGGEPTLRKDLEELISFASKNSAKEVEIQTNAILLSDVNYVDRLKTAGLTKAFVGLHSHLPVIHDRLVGVTGAFGKCRQGIKNLLASNIEVILNPVITTKNFKQLPTFIKYIHQEFPGIRYISLSVVQPRGRAAGNKKIVPSYGQISPYVKKALKLGKNLDLIINNPFCGLPFCQGGWDKYLDRCVEYCENQLKPKKERGKHRAKIKPPQCQRCKFNLFCNGVWPEYAALYSLKNLKPIIKV